MTPAQHLEKFATILRADHNARCDVTTRMHEETGIYCPLTQ